jgi:hypothetical protein
MSGIPVHQQLVPGFPLVRVICDAADAEGAIVGYCGSAADLIAAGIATPQMLAPRIKGTRRVDADGQSFWFDHYYTCKGGQPTERFRLRFRKTCKLLARLPGALEARERRLCADGEWRREFDAVLAQPLPQRDKWRGLRLVVDNTKGGEAHHE